MPATVAASCDVVMCSMIGKDLANYLSGLLAGVQAFRKDGVVYVVSVVGRVAAAVGHEAPAFAVACDVPNVLVPDHVVDPERPRVCLRPGRSFGTKCLSGSRPVVGNHAVQRSTLLMVRDHRWAHTAVHGDLGESRPHRSMDLDRVRLEPSLDSKPARWY